MRIAIINQVASTGGWRVLRQLVLSLKKNIRHIDITIFIDHKGIDIVNEIMQELSHHGVKFEQINITYKQQTKHKNKLLNIINKLFHTKATKKYTWQNIAERLNQYDDALFFWPYGITFPEGLKIPSYFIVQDLTVLYKFGFAGYNNIALQKCLHDFVHKSRPIVPSEYGKNDLLKYFNTKKEVHVIPWSNFSKDKKIPKSVQDKVLKKYGLKTKEYVFYPTNNSPHKNTQLCLGIADLLKRKKTKIKVVLCGFETSEITGHVEYTHIMQSSENNIFGLGVISDEELYVLIKNALCLFTTTFAEGGCGPASDAWIMGTPTVISDIPVLKENADRFGVTSEFASPYNANEFVEKILKIRKNPAKYQKICLENQKQMNKNWTWEHVAQKYQNIFENKPKYKIAFDFSFNTFVSAREGICVYNSNLFQTLLENYPNLEIDVYTDEINLLELQKSMNCAFEDYQDRIHFITQTIARKRWYQINLFKYVFCTIKQNLYETLYKITKNKHYYNRTNKWKSKKHNLCLFCSLPELISKSDADVAFVDFVSLTGAHNFRGPKVFMLHDLFTIPLADLFRDLLTNIDELNKNAVDNLKQYADEGTYFVTSGTYIRDEELLKYVSNLSPKKTSVIPFPPMIKKFNANEILSEQEFRKKFHINGAYIPYASQIRPNKNVILLLKALNRLHKKGVKVSVVTTGDFYGLKECADYIHENHLENIVIQTGSLSENDLYALYKYASLAVIPTIIEGLGMSGQCLEALSFGTIPVIHAKSWGIKESLELVGLSMKKADLNWVDLDDDKGLAKKIEEVLKNPKTHIEKQKHIIDAYTKRTWDDVAHDYMNLFKKIINKKHKK